MFETWSARPARAYGKAALQAWLAAMPAGVLRLKGLVRSDDGRWWLLQYAGRRGSVRPAAHAPDAAAVVAIGLRSRLPVTALAAFFGDDAGTGAA